MKSTILMLMSVAIVALTTGTARAESVIPELSVEVENILANCPPGEQACETLREAAANCERDESDDKDSWIRCLFKAKNHYYASLQSAPGELPADLEAEVHEAKVFDAAEDAAVGLDPTERYEELGPDHKGYNNAEQGD